MRVVLSIIFSLAVHLVYGQEDTTISVAPLLIVDSEMRSQTPGSDAVVLSASGQSLTQTLIRSGELYMKHYGAGSLATPSIRGGSANHTLLLWNGVPLTSPTLGLLDYSLVPNTDHLAVTLEKGGSTALWGSGAVSGTINVHSNTTQEHNFTSKTAVGSNGLLSQSLTGVWTHSKWAAKSSYSHESADRDFYFEPEPGLPMVQQENAAYHRHHFMQDVKYRLTDEQTLTGHLWVHSSSTELPPTTVQTRSAAFQKDAAIRTLVRWQYVRPKSVHNIKASYIEDHNDYSDPVRSTLAENVFRTYLLDATSEHQLGDHQLMGGLTASSTTAYTDGYEEGVAQQQVGLFVSHRMEKGALQMQTSVRQDMVDGDLIPVVPSVGVSYRLAEYVQVRSKASRDYRLPTLNDKYWRPGGNEDLLPESGWSFELGTDWTAHRGGWTVDYSATAYHRDLDNWILWAPSLDQPYWSAANVNAVISKGLEQKLVVTGTTGLLTWKARANYNYTRSEYQSSLQLPTITAGDQLLYTPVHSGGVGLELGYKSVQLSYYQQQTGATRGANADLPAYHVSDIAIDWHVKRGKYGLALELGVDNVTDQRYFVIERRPMPGRQYRIGVTLTL